MGDAVPIDDLPDSGSGAAVPMDDLPEMPRGRYGTVNTPGEAAAKLTALRRAVPTAAQKAIDQPLSTAEGAANFVKRNAIPTAAMGAGTAALDVAFPEGGIPLTIAEMLAKAGTSGAINAVTSKTLPESLGGEPGMPAGRAFMYGAAGEPLVGAPGLAGKIAEKRLGGIATKAGDVAVKSLDPEAHEAADPLLVGKQFVPFPRRTGGNVLTAQTDAARDPVINTIRNARSRYGRALGQAYTSLKGAQPLTDVQADGLRQGAQQISASMTSAPAPITQQFVNRLNALGETPERARLRREGYPESLIDSLAPRQPMTLDQVRGIWQELGKAHDTAQGADYAGTGKLRQLMEGELNQHLGPQWQQLRSNYRGHIRRWDYNDERQLWHANTPQEVTDFAFSKPEYAHDLMYEARGNPQRTDQLRGLFLQHIYGPLNDATMSRKEQLAAVMKRLGPYMKDPETARLVLGDQAGPEMRKLVSFAKFSSEFTDEYKNNPMYRQQVLKGIQQEVLNSRIPPDQAAKKIMGNIALANPEVGSAGADIIKQLPLPEQSSGHGGGFGSRMPFYHGAMLGMAGISALMGHKMGFGAAWQASSLGFWLMMDAAATYKGASRLGITVPIIKAMGSGNPNYAGRAIARAFLNAGQRRGQEVDLSQNTEESQ